MKKKAISLSLLALLVVFSTSGLAANDFSDSGIGFTKNNGSIAVMGSFLFSSDGVFQNLYGKQVLLPQAALSYAFSKSLFAWVDYSFMPTRAGEIPETAEKTSLSQQKIGAGLGIQFLLSEHIRVQLAAGPCMNLFREQAFERTSSASVWGFKGGLAFDISLGHSFFFRLNGTYNNASRSEEGFKMDFSGFQLGAGLGLGF